LEVVAGRREIVGDRGSARRAGLRAAHPDRDPVQAPRASQDAGGDRDGEPAHRVAAIGEVELGAIRPRPPLHLEREELGLVERLGSAFDRLALPLEGQDAGGAALLELRDQVPAAGPGIRRRRSGFRRQRQADHSQDRNQPGHPRPSSIRNPYIRCQAPIAKCLILQAQS
jgi:hypothetical protein